MFKYLTILCSCFFIQLNLAATTNPFGLFSEDALKNSMVQVHYAKAQDLVKLIKAQQKNLLSSHGTILADPRTNRIWLSDSTAHLKLLLNLIRQLDTPQQQILIKARILTIDTNAANKLGLKFMTSQNELVTNIANNRAQIPLIHLKNGAYLLTQIDALEQQGHAKLISNPQLMTSNRQVASIESGQDVPYQQQSGEGTTSVAFKKAVLKLQVKPTVLPNHKLLLDITVNQNKVSQLTVQGVPAISTQQLTTKVLVTNKHTVVLGGIYETTNSKQLEGIPLLDRLPLIGLLFGEHVREQKRQELLIFVTPVEIKEL